MKELSLNEVELVVKTMAEVAVANEKYFSELDAAAGDADFGVSLAKGFQTIQSKWEELDRSSIGIFLMKTGMIITSNVGGCSGPIWGTGFLRSGAKSKDKTALTLADLVEMIDAAMEGIIARGGAQLGDKTLLDAMAAAREVFQQWSQKQEQDFLGAFEEAAAAATATIESTRDWIAKRGRQSFTGERSKGTVDPGIVAVATMMQAVAKALRDADH